MMKEVAICLGTSSAGKTTFAKTQKEYSYFDSDVYFLTGIDSFRKALSLFVKKHDKIIVDGWIPREELTNLIKKLEEKYDLRYYFYIVVRDVRVITKTYQKKGARKYISLEVQHHMIYNCIDYVINQHGGKGVILQVLKKGYLTHPLRLSKDLLDKILYSEKENEKYT